MTTPLGKIQKPEADRYKKGRKLYLVPMFVAPPDATDEFQVKLEQYWSGAQEHIARMEAALGPVDRIYHETVFLSGEEGEKLVEQLDPKGYSLVRGRCEAGAQLEATEDRAMVDEIADWQRCLTMGLVSQKAASTVVQAYMDVTNQRYQYIASRIDETLKEDESAILVISDNHRVQCSGDIQVFYIAPPALNDIRRWINDRMVEVDRSGDDGEQGEAPGLGEEPESGEEEQPQQ